MKINYFEYIAESEQNNTDINVVFESEKKQLDIKTVEFFKNLKLILDSTINTNVDVDGAKNITQTGSTTATPNVVNLNVDKPEEQKNIETKIDNPNNNRWSQPSSTISKNNLTI